MTPPAQLEDRQTAPPVVARLEGAPRLWFVCSALGRFSEPWLWRQVVGMRRLRPRVVCWSHQNREAYPLNGTPVSEVPFPLAPHEGPKRWAHRLRNMHRWNFYATPRNEARYLVSLVQQDRPSVILCHYGHIALRMLPVARRMGIPLVAHFHGLDVSSGLQNRWYRWSLLKALRSFAAVVVVGSHQRQWMLQRGMPDKQVHLIPCGVPTSEFLPAVNTSPTPLRFICISRLTDFKGVDYSLHAFAQVAKRRADVQLTIIGDGPARSGLEALAASLNVAERVCFLGNLANIDARQRLQESHVFLQHSLDGRDGWIEGFGVSIAEAASCGLPVVVSRCGGIVDQVVEMGTGFIVEQRDVRAMGKAMLRLAENAELRQRMGQAGRRRMTAHFDTAGQVRKLEQVLLEAMRR